MTHHGVQRPAGQAEVRFQSRWRQGFALAFPSDAQGRVDIDTLTEREHSSYLFARIMVGREFETPVVFRRAAPGA